MRRIRHALWQRLGRRGCSLLWFGFLDLVYSFSLLVPPESARQSATLKFIDGVAPLWVWALAWGIPGVLCLVEAWLKDDRAAFSAAIAIKMIWGGIYVAGSIVAGLERAYVGAAVWFALAAFVAIISTWPEPRENDTGPHAPQEP